MMKQMLLSSPIFYLLSTVTGCNPEEIDWLIQRPGCYSSVASSCDSISMTNGLITRTFRLLNNKAFGTSNYEIHASSEFGGTQSMFRALAPEAAVILDGQEYHVGGLVSTDGFRAYCNRTTFESTLAVNDTAFTYVSHTLSSPVAPFPWTPGTRGSPADVSWPPKGSVLSVQFAAPKIAPPAHQALLVELHYSIFDDIPLLTKWMTISMKGKGSSAVKVTKGKNSKLKFSLNDMDVVVNSATVEMFAANAPFGDYVSHGSFAPGADFGGASNSNVPPSLLHAKTDQAHGSVCQWVDDYKNAHATIPGCADCKDNGAVEPLLSCGYTVGPSAHVNAKESFVSFKVIELATDCSDLVRHTLSRHRVTALLAPHTTENPIFFHATDVSDAGFKNAVDTMAATGFEMLIYSFGTDFVLETEDSAYIARIKSQVDYAKSKGIEVGGYDLICEDRGHNGYGGNVGDQWSVVAEDGTLTVDACFASGWVDRLEGMILNFMNQTGLSMLETDGPYGGATCHSTSHDHHHSGEDSVYRQSQQQNAFYAKMREIGAYVNQPDDFFFSGGSKTAMGYDEQQYSLPRQKQLSISRAGLFDDLSIHLPSMGWMFLPISPYHAGGADAMFAPLQQNIRDYELGLAQYLTAGIAACYRGPAPYDTDPVKDVVTKWTSFYRKHRHTLIQPIVPIRRPSMQSWDGFLHVNPLMVGTAKLSREVGIAIVFNPTDMDLLDQIISFPLYYTGASDVVHVSVNGNEAIPLKVTRNYHCKLIMPTMEAGSQHTFVFTLPLHSMETVQ